MAASDTRLKACHSNPKLPSKVHYLTHSLPTSPPGCGLKNFRGKVLDLKISPLFELHNHNLQSTLEGFPKSPKLG